MAMGKSDNDLPIAEINVTPLVDVMLVLLIIFMVTAPMLDQGLSLDLPQTKGSSLDSTVEKQLVLKILKDRSIRLNDAALRVTELKDKLLSQLRGHRDRTLYVRSDKDVSYGFVAYVIAEARAAGVTKLALVTIPLEAK